MSSSKERADTLDELLSEPLLEKDRDVIEVVFHEFAEVEAQYLTFARINKICGIFMENEDSKATGGFINMVQRKILNVLEAFVIRRPEYSGGLRMKKGLMTTVRSRLIKASKVSLTSMTGEAQPRLILVRHYLFSSRVCVHCTSLWMLLSYTSVNVPLISYKEEREQTLIAIREFLLEMVRLEHEGMREPRLRQDFLDSIVKVIDNLKENFPNEWTHYLELFLRMCDEQDTVKLIVTHRQEKRRKSKKGQRRKYSDHYLSLLNIVCEIDDMPMGVSMTQLLTGSLIMLVLCL